MKAIRFHAHGRVEQSHYDETPDSVADVAERSFLSVSRNQVANV